jgi:fucose permease
LLENRNVNKENIGYVASGFWGGVTLGRFILAPALPALFGVRRSVIILVLTLIVLNIVTWQVPNVYVAGVTISLTGFGIGPIYPMMVGLMTRILPRKIRFCALTLGTAFGSSGGSAIPFAVGMASEFVGTYILFPIVLVCLVGVLLSWLGQPHIERKGAINTLWQRIW